MNMQANNVPFTRVSQSSEHIPLILFHEVLFMFFDGQCYLPYGNERFGMAIKN